MVTDITEADGAEKRVSDGVGKDVRVRMSVEPGGVWDFDTAQNQFSSGSEAMNVVTDTASCHLS